MKRYAVRQISNGLNWFGVYDNIRNIIIDEGRKSAMEMLADTLNGNMNKQKEISKHEFELIEKSLNDMAKAFSKADELR